MILLNTSVPSVQNTCNGPSGSTTPSHHLRSPEFVCKKRCPGFIKQTMTHGSRRGHPQSCALPYNPMPCPLPSVVASGSYVLSHSHSCLPLGLRQRGRRLGLALSPWRCRLRPNPRESRRCFGATYERAGLRRGSGQGRRPTNSHRPRYNHTIVFLSCGVCLARCLPLLKQTPQVPRLAFGNMNSPFIQMHQPTSSGVACTQYPKFVQT